MSVTKKSWEKFRAGDRIETSELMAMKNEIEKAKDFLFHYDAGATMRAAMMDLAAIDNYLRARESMGM